jgi:hypothetical protein
MHRFASSPVDFVLSSLFNGNLFTVLSDYPDTSPKQILGKFSTLLDLLCHPASCLSCFLQVVYPVRVLVGLLGGRGVVGEAKDTK